MSKELFFGLFWRSSLHLLPSASFPTLGVLGSLPSVCISVSVHQRIFPAELRILGSSHFSSSKQSIRFCIFSFQSEELLALSPLLSLLLTRSSVISASLITADSACRRFKSSFVSNNLLSCTWHSFHIPYLEHFSALTFRKSHSFASIASVVSKLNIC